MSLKVWLPLNGDLHNQGLDGELNFATTGTITDVDGKIGKGKEFTAASAIAPYDFTLSNEVSVACWVYYNAFPSSSSNDWIVHLGSTSGYTNATLGLSTYHSTLLAIMIGGQTDYTYVHNFSLNTWYHIAFTWNNTQCKLYINGELKKTYTTLNNGTKLTSDKISLGANVTNSTTRFAGRLNDVRIYDHALSPKEVEEISKGLVLQYQLNNGGGGNSNLIPSFTNKTGAYWRFSLTENLQANQPYTLQLWNVMVHNSSVDNLGIVVCWGGKNIVLTSVIGEDYFSIDEDTANTDYLKCTFIPTEEDAASADANKQFLDIYNSEPVTTARGKYFEIDAWKLEKGTIATPWVDANVTISTTVYDTSGYANNGTINGVLTTSAGSPRYHVATNFSDFTNYITAPSLGLTECSYSMWVRPSADTTVGMVFSDYLSGICFGRGESYVYCHNNIALNPNNRYIRSTIANDDTWQHFVVCRTATGEINLYKNGELVSPNHTSASGFNHYETDQLLIGRRIGANQQDSTAYSIKGDIVDFREYATILTPAQIKELYLTSMIVNADGTTSPRELVS